MRLVERKMGMKLQDGGEFLLFKLKWLLSGNVLVCGDSETDLPMLEECLSVAAPTVYTIWVTKDEALKQKVIQPLIPVSSVSF